MNKVRSFTQVCHIVKRLKKQDKKVVLAHGCFDLLHIGHIALFKEAKEIGDVLVVGVEKDSNVRKMKGSRRPIIPDKLRAQVVASLENVDYVFLIRGKPCINTYIGYYKKLNPDILITGSAKNSFLKERKKQARAAGVLLKVRAVGRGTDYSTTKIIEKVDGSKSLRD